MYATLADGVVVVVGSGDGANVIQCIPVSNVRHEPQLSIHHKLSIQYARSYAYSYDSFFFEFSLHKWKLTGKASVNCSIRYFLSLKSVMHSAHFIQS